MLYIANVATTSLRASPQTGTGGVKGVYVCGWVGGWVQFPTYVRTYMFNNHSGELNLQVGHTSGPTATKGVAT